METQKVLSPCMFVEMLDRTCALRNATYDEDSNVFGRIAKRSEKVGGCGAGQYRGIKGVQFH